MNPVTNSNKTKPNVLKMFSRSKTLNLLSDKKQKSVQKLFRANTKIN